MPSSALLWIFSRSLPFLRQGDQHCTVHEVRWTAILYSDPVSFTLLSVLFLIITNILVSSFNCCWAPTQCFQSTIYPSVKRSSPSRRDHCRNHYCKCEIRIVFLSHVSLHIYLHWVSPAISLSSFIKTFWDSWQLSIAFSILNNFTSSINFVAQCSNFFQGHPWIWWRGEDPAQTPAKLQW